MLYMAIINAIPQTANHLLYYIAPTKQPESIFDILFILAIIYTIFFASSPLLARHCWPAIVGPPLLVRHCGIIAPNIEAKGWHASRYDTTS